MVELRESAFKTDANYSCKEHRTDKYCQLKSAIVQFYLTTDEIQIDSVKPSK